MRKGARGWFQSFGVSGFEIESLIYFGWGVIALAFGCLAMI
jgi:hypothetical protein